MEMEIEFKPWHHEAGRIDVVAYVVEPEEYRGRFGLGKTQKEAEEHLIAKLEGRAI